MSPTSRNLRKNQNNKIYIVEKNPYINISSFIGRSTKKEARICTKAECF